MAEDTVETQPKKKKGILIPSVLGIVLSGAGGFGGYYAASNNLIFSNETELETGQEMENKSDDIAFVEIQPLTILLGSLTDPKYLRFAAQIEVPAKHKSEIDNLLPRVIDITNNYLRAVRISDFQDPVLLTQIRRHLLHRYQVILGDEKVRQVLITEFVVS